jgi:hypothetical protein
MARETLDQLEARAAKATKRAQQMLHRAERLRDRALAREERDAKTRRYQLGQVLESFVFDEPELLAQLKTIVQHEPLEHVRAAFRLVGGGPSWFEQPERDEATSAIDTRRVRLGMILEQLLRSDAALRDRMEALMLQQSPRVRGVFGLDGEGRSWFDTRAQP